MKKIKRTISLVLSAVMLSTSINVVQTNASQVLYGDYVLISNTSLDWESAQSTGNIVFDSNGVLKGGPGAENTLGNNLDIENKGSAHLYTSGGSTKTPTQKKGSVAYTVGHTENFGTSTTYECIAVSPHCYVWADTVIGYTASEKTTAGSAAAEQFEKAYTDYLQPYDFDKYISYEDYSDRMSIIIKLVADGADRSWYFSGNADVTAIYCPVYAADHRTDFKNTYPVMSHECQHAMADSAGVIYGLWLNEALSVSIMPNHADWLYMGSSAEARGQSFVNGWAYTDYGYFDYAQPYEFIRYLNTQANKGVYKNGACGDNEAYRKFYSYFYTTNVPSNYTKTQKDIYVIEYLMSEYHKADSSVFANDDGSVWTFNDALRYFRIAQMKHESTGKYGFGQDTEIVREQLPYYTVYTGESGKSTDIYGTGAIMVKTLNGQFEVPASHGANIEYTAFNAVVPWSDGINTISSPTKREYNSGDTLDVTGLKLVYSKDGVVTEITDWDGLEAAGLYLYILDTSNLEKSFTKVTRNTRIGAPYADSSGKERYIVFCSDVNTIYYTRYQRDWQKFFVLDTEGISVTKGDYDTEFIDSEGYYRIYNKTDLDDFIAQMKPSNKDTQKARLYADIEFTADKLGKDYRQANWTTLTSFSGVFDGNGHSISGICVTGSKKCSIFGDLYGKVINLTIKNSCFTDTETLTYFGGGIADHVESSGLIENCTLGSDVYVNGGHAGGFAGSLNGGKISKCSSDAVITALSDGNAGGICGVIQYGTIENCRFGGTLSCTDSAGGIVSCVNHNSGDSYVKNCYSIGNISSNTAKAIATVSDSGSNTASVTNCYYLSGKGTDEKAQALSSTQFASGEAAYLLNTNGDNVWYQNIDITPKDSYPVLDKSHGAVIKKTSGYGNDTSVTVETTTETTTQAAVSYDSNGFGSDGSYQQPSYTNSAYQISNAGQLYWYAAYINKGSKANAVLTKDITVNGGKMTASSSGARAWTPIAAATGHSEGVFFTNSFDGKGHTVSGLYCGADPFFAGLFGCIGSGGTVKNLGVINSYFKGDKGAGAVSGGNSNLTAGGTVENCYSVNNTITATDNAGGIIGGCWKAAYIKNCYVLDCSITGSSGFSMPITGYLQESAGESNCFYGSISGSYSADAKATSLTKAQFASGEAAYRLNSGDSYASDIWYQTLSSDTYPVLDSTHKKVYAVSGGYSNTAAVTTEKTTETTTLTTTTKATTTKATTTTTETTTETTTHQQTTNAEGYDENGFGDNGNCQPADLVNNIYEIGNMGQLYWYANYINSGNKGDAALTADIVFNPGTYDDWDSVYGWTPIGNATDHDQGTHYINTFDGRGHYISGLYCRSFGDNDEYFFAGLFGCLSTGAVVKNTSVINSYFYSTKGSGAIAGGGSNTVNNGGTVINCCSAYNIIISQDNAGGIVGGAWKGTTIQNCICAYSTLTANNSSSSSAFTGPMAGYIATGDSASTSGGKYIGADMNSNSTKLHGDSSSKQYYAGDADLNGKVDIRDAIAAQKISFAYSSLASYTADMNKDKKITKADAAAILKQITAA